MRRMAILLHRTGLKQGKQTWIILGMLLLVVIVPTVCLLWFVTEAVRNERMAVRQKLIDSYGLQLGSLQSRLKDHWDQKIMDLSQINDTISQDEKFPFQS